MNVRPAYNDVPPAIVSLEMPHKLHDAMKELAKRKRMMLGAVYEMALEHLLSQLASRKRNYVDRKRVNLTVDRGIHIAAREVASISAVYEVACLQFLALPENYLGEEYTMESIHASIEKPAVKRRKKGQAQDRSGGNRQDQRRG